MQKRSTEPVYHQYFEQRKVNFGGAFLRGDSFEHGVYSGAAAGVQDSRPRRRRIARGAHGNPCGTTGFGGDYARKTW